MEYSFLYTRVRNKDFPKGEALMKGYTNENGYMGLIDGEYMLFATEEDYFDYCSDIPARITDFTDRDAA